MTFEELDEKKSIVSAGAQDLVPGNSESSVELVNHDVAFEKANHDAAIEPANHDALLKFGELNAAKSRKVKNLKLPIIPGGYVYFLAVLTVLALAGQIQRVRAETVYFVSQFAQRQSAFSGDPGLKVYVESLTKIQDKAAVESLFDKTCARGCSVGGAAERPLAEIDAILDFYGEDRYDSIIGSRLKDLVPKLDAFNALQSSLKSEMFARHPRVANALLTWARAVKKDQTTVEGVQVLPLAEQNKIAAALYETLLSNWQYQVPWDTSSNIRSELGEIYESEKLYSKAYQLFFDAYQTRKNFGDVDYNAYRLAHIGGNLMGMGRVAEGRKALQEADAMAQRLHFDGLNYLSPYIESHLITATSGAYTPVSASPEYHDQGD